MAEIPQFEVGSRISSESKVTYKVVQRLGAGGNSHVYLVQAITGELRGVLFALKLFVRISDKTREERFKQEVVFLKECSHPAIMRVYDQGKIPMSDGSATVYYPFVVADYLPKRLRDAIREGISMAEKVTYISQLLSGLAYLANRKDKIVHRDIKPENIFIRGRSCILGDFGLMKVLQSGPPPEGDTRFFIESIGPRLPYFYRSPDLVAYCKHSVELSPKSDVYQLGLIAAELFSGRNPLRRVANILDDVELEELDPIGGSQAAAIGSEIRRMLECDPAKRPSAHDLYDKWEGIFFEIVRMSHSLEGRVF